MSLDYGTLEEAVMRYVHVDSGVLRNLKDGQDKSAAIDALKFKEGCTYYYFHSAYSDNVIDGLIKKIQDSSQFKFDEVWIEQTVLGEDGPCKIEVGVVFSELQSCKERSSIFEALRTEIDTHFEDYVLDEETQDQLPNKHHVIDYVYGVKG